MKSENVPHVERTNGTIKTENQGGQAGGVCVPGLPTLVSVSIGY